jgi:hypothetical protein
MTRSEPMEDGLNASRDLSHAVGGVREPLDYHAILQPIADRYFAESNARGKPQWHRKAHAHAWAGVCRAIAALDAAAASPAEPLVTDPGKTTEGLNQ